MTSTIAPPPSTTRSTRRWLALSVLALAQFLVILDATIVNIALPAIGIDLQMDTAALAWIVTAYVLAFGGLLLVGGRLADRFGHRRVFLIGVAGFVASSALAGLSLTSEVLLGARVLQGASAALLAPAALALLTQLFPGTKDRTTALGIWGGIAGIGAAAGVLLGGVLTSGLGWQSVFFVNVPVGLIALVATPLLITRDTQSVSSRFDLRGLLRNRNVAVGNVIVLIVGAAMVALFFALSVYLQSVLGYSSLSAGLASLPLAGILVVVAATAPMIVARLGLTPTLVGSLLVLAAGLVWIATAPSDASFVVNILGPSLLIGVGIGGALVTATQLSVDGVDAADSGLAGGLMNTSQQLGGAVGLAALSTLAAARTSALVEAGTPMPDALTSGFSWLFIGAAVLAVIAAIVAGLAARRG